jgi:hypothetical protein
MPTRQRKMNQARAQKGFSMVKVKVAGALHVRPSLLADTSKVYSPCTRLL